MRATLIGVSLAIAMASGFGVTRTSAQSPGNRIDAHVAAAKAAAATDFAGVFSRICAEAVPPATPATPATPRAAAPRPAGPPPRSEWHSEPAKVFDNLYFLGQTEYSVWAVTTSAGIILIDTIYDYSVEDEVVGGMKKLGLDPTQIKYIIVSHGHADHSGGARFLQDTFKPRVILSAADWDLLDRNTAEDRRPKRDMVASDGMKLALGDTTLTLYLTPGHTAGTISTLIPVKDNGVPHLVAEWGGTMFNFTRTRDAFDTYISSAERFEGIAARAGADVVISNHTIYDGTKTKIPALANRRPGDPNPYVIGTDAVKRYLAVARNCAHAAQAAMN